METSLDATATSLCASNEPFINFPDVLRPVVDECLRSGH